MFASWSSVMFEARVSTITRAVSLFCRSFFLTPAALKRLFHSSGRLATSKPFASSHPMCVTCLKLVGIPICIAGSSSRDDSRSFSFFLPPPNQPPPPSFFSFSFFLSFLPPPFGSPFGAIILIFCAKLLASASRAKHTPHTSCSNSIVWKKCVPRFVFVHV